MFKNLDGFKKVKEDKDTAVMQHPKGHTISVALKALPAMHRKQLMALPLHKCEGGAIKMAEGGQIKHYDEGGGAYNGPPPVPTPPPEATPTPIDPNAPIPTGESAPTPGSPGATGIGPDDEDDDDAAATPPAGQSAAATPGATTASTATNSSAAPTNGGLPDISPQSIYGLGVKAGNERYNAEVALNKANAKIEDRQQLQLQNEQYAYNQGQAELIGHMKDTMTDLLDSKNKIDPKAYLENMDTPKRIATGIGLLLGGFSTPFTHQGNPALEMLNKQIDRDVDAQKANQNTKWNVYNAYNQQYKNSEVAYNMAKATQMAIYASKLKQAAAVAGTPKAKAIQDANLMVLQQQALPLVQRSNFLLQNQAINQRAQQGQLSALPPEQLVKLTGATPEEQNKMYEETKNRADIVDLAPKIKDAFIRGSSKNPVVAAQGQRAFEALMNTTVKEKEDTARAAAFDSIHKTLSPSGVSALPGENESRWNSTIDYLQSKGSAPVSNGHGLNLDSYQSTSLKSLSSLKNNQPEPIQHKNGGFYVPQVIQGKQYMIPVNQTGKAPVK